MVGTSESGETLCASDVPAILPYTEDVIYMDDGDIAELSRNRAKFWTAKASRGRSRLSISTGT